MTASADGGGSAGGGTPADLKARLSRMYGPRPRTPAEVEETTPVSLPLPDDLVALGDVQRTLDILSTSTDLPPASEILAPTSAEKRINFLRTQLVNELSKSEDSHRIDLMSDDAARAVLKDSFEKKLDGVLAHERITATSVERQEIVRSCVDEVLGCGPIERLLQDPTVSEIMVNNPRVVFVERKGRLERTEVRFFDDEHMMNVLSRIVARVGRQLDLSHPHVDARLRDGSRVHAIIPPLALDGPVLTIRKFKKESLQIEDIITFGTMTPDMAYFLGAGVKARLNILVGGGTGSGKTTLLNVLSSLVPPGQRIVTIEDAAELKVHESHPHVVRLESKPGGVSGRMAVTVRDLVRDALRMRPDRIIVGECRGGEALDMLQAMNTGHDGSMTTAHANSAEELIDRVETMCLMAGLDLPAVAIRRQLASALDLVVHLRRYPDGTRKISEISEVVGFEGDRVKLRPLFWYEVTGRGSNGRVEGGFRSSTTPPRFIHKFDAEGLNFPVEIFSPPTAG